MRTVGSVFHKRFDHVIVASGHNHYPHAPTWEGVEGWLDNTPQGTPKREIIHSIYYREPERYRGRTVVVLVAGGSGKDAAQQIAPLARKVRSL
jgi:cation diffusion facilitator CzcD-associated flavoprotein CzcO